MNEVTHTLLGIASCRSMHDHGEVPVVLRYARREPLVFKLSAADDFGDYSWELPRSTGSGATLLDWVRQAKPGDELQLGGATLRIRRRVFHILTILLPSPNVETHPNSGALLMLSRRKFAKFLADTEELVSIYDECDELRVDDFLREVLKR